MKNFHACDDFFKLLVEAHVVALVMHTAGFKTINAFRIELSQSDWPPFIHETDVLCLPFTIGSIRAKAKQDVEEVAEILLATRKSEWEALCNSHSPLPEPEWDVLEVKLSNDLTSRSRNIQRQNALVIVSCGLLYLNFWDACRKEYSGRIEKCIECFAVLFQDTSYITYGSKIIHLVACLKHLWKEDFRQAWLDYYVINSSGGKDMFMADNRFGKTIIMLNKEKVQPLANAKSDSFLCKTVALNVMLLWKCKEIMARITWATFYGNRHLLVSIFPDMSLLVTHLVEHKAFEEQLERGMEKETQLPDVFSEGTTNISSGVALKNYLNRAQEN